jgi:hypothetical protein
MALSITHSTVVVVADDGTSPVGSDEWNDDHAITGTVGPDVGARELLTADRTYFVATTGSDANDGLTALTPCATVQHVYDDIICATLDKGGFDVTIQLADGSYTHANGVLRATTSWLGAGDVIIKGNSADTDAVTITASDGGSCIDSQVPLAGSLRIRRLKLLSATYVTIRNNSPGSIFTIDDDVEFGASSYGSLEAATGGVINVFSPADLTISGGASFGVSAAYEGQIYFYPDTLTLVGTPAFSSAFAIADLGGFFDAFIGSTIGTATGKRYIARDNAAINTYDSGPNHFPGDVVGTATDGGRYDGASDDEREVLTADRTYYVRTDGSDSNTGLADNAGGAFLTIQHAYDVIAGTIDMGGQTVTVQVRTGTFDGVDILQPLTGGGILHFLGDTTTPSNVVIDAGANDACFFFQGNFGSTVYIGGFKTGASGSGIYNDGIGLVKITGKMIFDTCAGNNLICDTTGAFIFVDSDYEISGNFGNHYNVSGNGLIYDQAVTVSLTGTPAIAGLFAIAFDGGVIQPFVTTFSGSATGKRYDAYQNGVINTGGSGATFLPGDVAGTTATGGQYV